MDVLDDYVDLYKEDGDARIFTLLFNTSNLISPAYAAAIVLGISFGIAALAGLLYYALIGGFDSDGGYGGYSQYSSYLNKLGIRRRRSTFDDDLDLVSILGSLNSSEDTLSQGENEIVDTDQLSPANLCKIKLNFCQISHGAISSNVPTKKVTDYENIKNLKKFFMGLRKMKDKDRNLESQQILHDNILEDFLMFEEQLRKRLSCDAIMKMQRCS